MCYFYYLLQSIRRVSECLFVNFLYLFVCLFVCLSICLFICLSVHCLLLFLVL